MKFNTILEIDLKKLYDNASILAKSYSDDEVKGMINGVLDKIYHNK